MTEEKLRQKAVDAMRGWLGAVPGSAKHADILRTYNAHRPLARSYHGPKYRNFGPHRLG